MKKKRTKKSSNEKITPEETKDFLRTGEREKEEILTDEKPIYFDGRQYSVKLPTRFMEMLGFDKGDKLKFKLINPLPIKPDLKPKLVIEYAKK